MTKTLTAAEDIANIKSRLDEAFNEGNRATRRASKKILEAFKFNDSDFEFLLEDAVVADGSEASNSKLSLQKIRELFKSSGAKLLAAAKKAGMEAARVTGKGIKFVVAQMFQAMIITFGGLIAGSAAWQGIKLSTDLGGMVINLFSQKLAIGAIAKAIAALFATVMGIELAKILASAAMLYLIIQFVKLAWKLYWFILHIASNITVDMAVLTNNAIENIRKWFGEDDVEVAVSSERLAKEKRDPFTGKPF